MPPIRPLAEGDVRFVGDPVALIVAESRYAAEDAAELVELDIEPLGVVVDRGRRTRRTSPGGAPRAGNELGGRGAKSPGSRRGSEHSPTPLQVVTETFHQHRYNCVPMEPRGLIASWDPAQQSLTIYASTQGPHEVRANMSRLLRSPRTGSA